jgi:DMSO/TMAO reductase YedYZ molybdopterin-dependent catalytic subunit
MSINGGIKTMSDEKQLPRREVLQRGLAIGAIASTAGMSFWSELALAQGEVLVPFVDVPDGFTAPPVTPGAMHFLDTRQIDTFYTSADDFYIVQHYNQPVIEKSGYTLRLTGLVERPLSIAYADLIARNKVEIDAGFECGGNNANLFHGLIGNARWGGIRLRDLLREARVQTEGIEAVFYGADTGTENVRDRDVEVAFGRSMHIDDAMLPDVLVAWEMNGEPLPALHGFPLRLICPGWPGSTSGKWLKRLWIRDRVHDGAKMTGDSYRLPRHLVAPGSGVSDDQMDIIEELPVKSIVTFPGTGIEHPQSAPLALRGHAWSGFGDVREMHLSIDFGQTWQPAELKSPRNRYAWQRWNTEVRFPTTGYFEVWARATDVTGRMQPMLVPGWNPKGYCNNAMQRIAIKVV